MYFRYSFGATKPKVKEVFRFKSFLFLQGLNHWERRRTIEICEEIQRWIAARWSGDYIMRMQLELGNGQGKFVGCRPGRKVLQRGKKTDRLFIFFGLLQFVAMGSKLRVDIFRIDLLE